MDEEVKVVEPVLEAKALWNLPVTEIVGLMIEVRGRNRVNALLKKGWKLLHIYTLTYREDGIWRERPMAILGKLRS